MKVGEKLAFTLPSGNNCIYYLREQDILEIFISGPNTFDVEDTIKMVETTGSFANGKKFRMLIKSDPNIQPTPAAQKYSSGAEGSKYKIADAFIVNNIAQKLIANFIIKFHRPVVPTKVFHHEEKAISWLLEQ
ncbi:DUF7793 family protein [Parvicella tangerina]|uniref:DUF7793 domain-containing protein n=1 Tax=Parvicella tangerina TaxID=2829795 RepID=A0A916JMN5_9FLAO|nr:hypothetical protein [Parvicella tangerina]CAG5082129.1 hypothetical protein CRYO30217_01815 [Parvicella tangerina]